MAPEIEKNINSIIETCKLMGVKSLSVFGSAARVEDYRTSSDIDFLYSMFTNEEGLPINGFDYFDLMSNWKK